LEAGEVLPQLCRVCLGHGELRPELSDGSDHLSDGAASGKFSELFQLPFPLAHLLQLERHAPIEAEQE
jgi:hypothetical protein